MKNIRRYKGRRKVKAYRYKGKVGEEVRREGRK